MYCVGSVTCAWVPFFPRLAPCVERHCFGMWVPTARWPATVIQVCDAKNARKKCRTRGPSAPCSGRSAARAPGFGLGIQDRLWKTAFRPQPNPQYGCARLRTATGSAMSWRATGELSLRGKKRFPGQGPYRGDGMPAGLNAPPTTDQDPKKHQAALRGLVVHQRVGPAQQVDVEELRFFSGCTRVFPSWTLLKAFGQSRGASLQSVKWAASTRTMKCKKNGARYAWMSSLA